MQPLDEIADEALGAVATINLKGLHVVRAKGHRYLYLWRGGPRIETESELGTPQFMLAYNRALEASRLLKLPHANLAQLIRMYEASTAFTTIGERTQNDYRRYLRIIEDEFGTMPIRAIGSPKARCVFKEWRDGIAKTSRKSADMAWAVLRRVLKVGKDRGKIGVKPWTSGGFESTA